MKKGLRKLILSGTALAAVAATLGTSTYAWYTTNPTVSANNIVGASSDSGSSSIYIAKDTAGTKAWSSSVTFANDDFATAQLIPVQPTSTAGSFKKLDGSDASATDVLSFSLWFKSSKVADTATEANGIPLYIKSIKFLNTTTTALPSYDNLIYGDTVKSADTFGVSNQNALYAVDFLNSLAMEVTDVTDAKAATDTTPAVPAVLKQKFEVASFAGVAADYTAASVTKPTAAAGTTLVENGKAHAYYNEVMETDLTTDAITAGKALTTKYTKEAVTTLNATGTNDTARKLTFYVYLNGWNDFCYDACQGQTFNLKLEFTNDATKALATVS